MRYLTVLVGFFLCHFLKGQVVAVNSDAVNGHRIFYHFIQGFENKVILLDTSKFNNNGNNFRESVCSSCKIEKVEHAKITTIRYIDGIAIYNIIPDTIGPVSVKIYNEKTQKYSETFFPNNRVLLTAVTMPEPKGGEPPIVWNGDIDSVKIIMSVFGRRMAPLPYIINPEFKVLKSTLIVTDSTFKIERYKKEFLSGHFTKEDCREYLSKSHVSDVLNITNVEVKDKYGVIRKASPTFRRINSYR